MRDKRSASSGLEARDLAAKPLFTAHLKHHVPYPRTAASRR